MQKWLSFIVPIYNAENYLRECVDSLLDQNYPKDQYEIILYDDGSTDNSFQIAKEYAEKYSNVYAFTHHNSGVSETRNAGLREAVGEYIWFIDNDDRIFKDILPVLYDWAKGEDVDMLIFGSVSFNGNNYWKNPDFIVKEIPVISGMKAFMSFYYDPVPWNKLLRRAFIEKYHLYFVQRLSEDSEWGSRCFYHAERVKAIAVDAIYYRVFDASFSHKEANRKLLLEQGLLLCLENHYKYMLDHPGNKYWMHALVLDLRRIHNVGLDRLSCTKEEKRSYIYAERTTCRKIIRKLPVSLQMNYVILLLCAIYPPLIINTQRFLRKMKLLKSKITK